MGTGRIEFQAVNETLMSRAPQPFRPAVIEPFGIVAGSFAREAADRDYQIGFHCHTVPQNLCPTLRQSGAARTYHRTKSSGY